MIQPNRWQHNTIALPTSLYLGILLLLLSGLLASCGRNEATPEPEVQQVAATPESAGTPAAEPTAPLHPPSLGLKPDVNALPTRLQLPAINVDIPVVELGWSEVKGGNGKIFAEWDVAEYAAGWHKNSALPGTSGNVVMSGHNNILGAVFRELDQLQRGDPVVVWAGRDRYRYRVEQIIIVPEKHATPEQRAENARWIGPFDDNRLTLVSCWPRDDNTHRIIVIAYPMDENQASRR